MATKEVVVKDVYIGGGHPLALIAGPCVIEDEASCLLTAKRLKGVAVELGIPFIFKSSFDKANRTSHKSFRGPGLKEGLATLRLIRDELDIPVLSDVHEVAQVDEAAEVLDVLQIPAFLCRQTDLITEAARTGRALNIKKGQFLSPWDMEQVIAKALAVGNEKILVTERGSCFGYNNLVVDMRSLPILRSLGFPVIFDATHSLQLPGGAGTSSGGDRRFIPSLARAGVAVGVDGLFMEVHPDPDRALCDGPNSLALSDLKSLLSRLKQIDELVKDDIR